jgi:6-phosphogluconolactonase
MKTTPKYNLQVFATATELNVAAANFIIDIAEKSIEARGYFAISLSGGHTPEKLYALLAEPPYSEKMPWSKTFIFWGDERCVPMNDSRNNAYMAESILLDKVNIPAANVHPIAVSMDPADAARVYEQDLKDFFGNEPQRFDLIMLGLGANGHTASLFPGTPVVNEKEVGIRDVYLAEEKMYRITMTAPLINLAHNVLFLVTGAEKAATLKSVLTGPYDPEVYPSQLIQPEPDALYWFADEESARDL